MKQLGNPISAEPPAGPKLNGSPHRFQPFRREGLARRQSLSFYRPGRWTVLAAFVATAVGTLVALMLPPALALALAVSASLIAPIAFAWPGLAIVTLGTSVIVDRWSLELAGASLRPEYLAAIVVLTAWSLRHAHIFMSNHVNWQESGKWLLERMGGPLATVGLALWLASNFLSSLVNSPDALFSLRQFAILVFMLLIFLAASLVLVESGAFRRAVEIQFWLAAGLGLVAVLSMLLLNIGVSTLVLYSHDTGLPAPTATLWETNVLGSFLAATLPVTVVIALADGSRFGWRLVGLALILSGFVLAGSRGAWLALATVALVAVLVERGRLWTWRRPRWSLSVAAFAGVAVAIALVIAGPQLLQRFSTIFNLSNDPTVSSRLDLYRLAWGSWLQSPLLGWGTGSFGLLYTYDFQPAWVGNLVLHLLQDAGLLGLAGFALFVGALVARSWRGSAGQPLGRAVCYGAVVMLISYQFTEATWLGLTWWYLALLVSVGQRAPGNQALTVSQ